MADCGAWLANVGQEFNLDLTAHVATLAENGRTRQTHLPVLFLDACASLFLMDGPVSLPETVDGNIYDQPLFFSFFGGRTVARQQIASPRLIPDLVARMILPYGLSTLAPLVTISIRSP